MKNYVEAVGIDVSKNTLDVFCYLLVRHKVFSNDPKGYASMLKWVDRCVKGKGEVLYCFENTGNYSLKLAMYLSSKEVFYVQENPVVIKRSSGLVREKNDKVDSAMIARYAWLHREELKPSTLKDTQILELGRLLSLRDQMVRNRTGLKSSLKEMKKLLSSPSTDTCCKSLANTIGHLDRQVNQLETRIKALLEEHEELNRNYRLLVSLKGVGLIVAGQFIYHTNNFKNFENWRQFSSYCGTAPFDHSSGTSIHRRRQCHPMGDRKMKSLLSMAGVSAIQHDSELRMYYKRKLEEGKLKMVALNNVRNKLIARMFAVVKRGTPYVELSKYAA